MKPTAIPESAAASLAGPETATSEIDVSCRAPLVVFFLSAAGWLLIASGLALICSIQFHSPDFLAGLAWLSYGRAHPAASSAFLYGFCLQSGLGVSLWLLARLGRTRLDYSWLATVGAMSWNLGVAVGVWGILTGDRTGFEALDLPGYATPMVFLGWVLAGIQGALTFHRRRRQTLYVSQWFLLAALFWFAWIYATAQLLLVSFPGRGVAPSVIAWWYAQNLQVVWLWLAGLGAVFYFVPKLSGRPLQNRGLALCAFWFIVVFGGWGGIPHSAPVPAWLPALSTVGSVFSAVALLAVGLSLWKTARQGSRPAAAPEGRALPEAAPATPASAGSLPALSGRGQISEAWPGAAAPGAPEGLPLRFVLFGALAFLIGGGGRVLGSLPPISSVTDLTWFGPAMYQLNAYGFFAMVIFGAVYWIMPRLLGLDFPWAGLGRAHFWLASAGIVLLAAPLAIAGVLEGLKLRGPENAFMGVVKAALPALRVSTLGELFMALGHAAFLANLASLAARFCRLRAVSTFRSWTLDPYKPAEAKP